jgi:hypothetical protein
MNRTTETAFGAFIVPSCVAIGGAVADDVAIDRYTIDGGGMMVTTGGIFEVSGTIGQADAGVMSGGVFSLSGGFWFGIGAGDLDEDGDVDLHDFTVFEACLSGPGVAAGSQCVRADFDADADVDQNDFGGFQAVFPA